MKVAELSNNIVAFGRLNIFPLARYDAWYRMHTVEYLTSFHTISMQEIVARHQYPVIYQVC